MAKYYTEKFLAPKIEVKNGSIERIATKDVEYIISSVLGVKDFKTSSEYV